MSLKFANEELRMKANAQIEARNRSANAAKIRLLVLLLPLMGFFIAAVTNRAGV